MKFILFALLCILQYVYGAASGTTSNEFVLKVSDTALRASLEENKIVRMEKVKAIIQDELKNLAEKLKLKHKRQLQTQNAEILAKLQKQITKTQSQPQSELARLKPSLKNTGGNVQPHQQRATVLNQQRKICNQGKQNVLTLKKQVEKNLKSPQNNETSLNQQVQNLQSIILKERTLNTQYSQRINDTIQDYENKLINIKSESQQTLQNTTRAHKSKAAWMRKELENTQNVYFYITGMILQNTHTSTQLFFF